MGQIQNIELAQLLEEFVGTSDVLPLDYKPIDQTTTKERLDFQKVRGSIRLANRKIKTYADVNLKRADFISLQIP